MGGTQEDPGLREGRRDGLSYNGEDQIGGSQGKGRERVPSRGNSPSKGLGLKEKADLGLQECPGWKQNCRQ